MFLNIISVSFIGKSHVNHTSLNEHNKLFEVHGKLSDISILGTYYAFTMKSGENLLSRDSLTFGI